MGFQPARHQSSNPSTTTASQCTSPRTQRTLEDSKSHPPHNPWLQDSQCPTLPSPSWHHNSMGTALIGGSITILDSSFLSLGFRMTATSKFFPPSCTTSGVL